MSDDENLDNALDRLSKQVSKFSGTDSENTSNKKGLFSMFSKFSFNPENSFVYYGAIPVCIAVALAIWKPGFVMKEVSVDGNMPEQKLCFSRLIVATVIITTIIAILIFIRSYGKKPATKAQ